ncbi:MAG: sigma-54 interaction domain-containing protein [Lentisphaeria bacterium]|jgi:PAS domain S-box-containing protein
MSKRNKSSPGNFNPLEFAILDSLNEGVFTVDRNWRLTSFNRAAERLTGIPREQAIGAYCSEVFRASICEKNCVLRRTIESGQPVVDATAHIVNQSGQRLPIRLAAAPLKDSTGAIIGGVETFQDLSQVEQLRKELQARYSFEDIIGHSPLMTQLFDILPQIAASSSTVLIEGASGTGKELFARAIHNLSPRKDKPFVAVNCAALPDTLLESELFGFKAGAFTDARQDKPGRFALADGGTIFLDEIGDISPAMQVRLLRVLQEREIEPLGGIKPIPIDVRIITATNKNLAELVSQGVFREDLFYRVRVVYLKLPRLAQRPEDLPLLVEHFISKFNHLQNKSIAGVSDEVMARLMEHDFPGNVRELENIIEQAFVLCRSGLIETKHLPIELRTDTNQASGAPRQRRLADIEKAAIENALRRHGGNRSQAAAELDINPSTLYRKIRTYGIVPPPADGRNKRR